MAVNGPLGINLTPRVVKRIYERTAATLFAQAARSHAAAFHYGKPCGLCPSPIVGDARTPDGTCPLRCYVGIESLMFGVTSGAGEEEKEAVITALFRLLKEHTVPVPHHSSITSQNQGARAINDTNHGD